MDQFHKRFSSTYLTIEFGSVTKMTMTDDNHNYAEYMLRWVQLLKWPKVETAEYAMPLIKSYWHGNKSLDLESLRRCLWTWVDANGGSQMTQEKSMVLVRMLLCLAYEDNRELEDMGFFDDLLELYGLPRTEINKYDAANPPPSNE